jgi:MYXO-CTERM domain-containing protein
MHAIKIQTSICCAAAVAAGLASTARGITVDGTLDGGYGSALAVQTVNTSFGDSTVGDGTSVGGSELDAGYGIISGGNLYLFLAGNFENNGNHVNIFLSDGRTGQSTLAAPATGTMQAMNGSAFSSGFQATYAIDLNDYANTAYVEQYSLNGTPSGGYVGAIGLTGGIGTGSLGGIQYGINNLNAAGVVGGTGAANSSAALAVGTGLEIAIPLSFLGNPTSVSVLASINGGGDNYLSNQLLPGLSAGSGSLGTSGFNFSSTPGEYFTVVATPEPSSMVLGASGLATLLLLRRRR